MDTTPAREPRRPLRGPLGVLPAFAPYDPATAPLVARHACDECDAWARAWARESARRTLGARRQDWPRIVTHTRRAQLAGAGDVEHQDDGPAAGHRDELPPARWPEAAASTAPTRGPDRGPPGALATARAAPP